MAESEVPPERRRRRPTMRRKIRCNRETPCSNCMRSKNDACVYEKHPSHPQPLQHHVGQIETARVAPVQEPRRLRPLMPVDTASSTSQGSTTSSRPMSSLPTSTATSPPSDPSVAQDVEHLRSRIRQLEDELAKVSSKANETSAPASASNLDIEPAAPQPAAPFRMHGESRLFGEVYLISRSVIHKTRLFGQSHWVHGTAVFGETLDIIEPIIRETSRAVPGMQRCKHLAKIIKSRRAPPWPSPPTTDLPSKDVADKLVDGYLRTMETIYRVLHIPTFMAEYEAVWASDSEPDAAFLVQLKLVFAIGATIYDENFSLRGLAIKWVYEAQTWLSTPEFKSRLGLRSLQINILLLLARETSGVGEDLVWIAAGSLIRTAIHIGLHRDPEHLLKRTFLAAEMRRRLWNTILEIALQSSMRSGGPPLIDLNDFNTCPPGNFNDEQLTAENPVPKPDDCFTQTSIAIALRSTVPIRLAIVKFLNNLSSNGPYEETLRLDVEFRKSYKNLCQVLKECQSNDGSSPSQFSMQVVDFIMRRFLSSLHTPFFGASLKGTAYAFSRKVVVDASLKVWCAVFPSTSIATAQPHDTVSREESDFARLTACGSVFFRTIAVQACYLLASELRAQLCEEDSVGPICFRPTLLSILDETKSWCLRCIDAGETNTKGYLFTCVIAAEIEGLLQGINKDEFPELLVKAAEDAEERCIKILEEKVAQSQANSATDGLIDMTLNTPPDMADAWDFMMTDTQFGFGNMDPMGWALSDELTQHEPLW
ncbi:hypothetical protein AK830_g5519 [Neonectria ditissima]|uniref:Xylanolytic transcriptional activator regulatory domain-containing protein n=1 Tax=Neonectria ditissima TaxID=78410 RepID=A0A0P7B3P1_9HYPO|nr:hypothetical protein AK830_g5519 [Neonectria ditissima]